MSLAVLRFPVEEHGFEYGYRQVVVDRTPEFGCFFDRYLLEEGILPNGSLTGMTQPRRSESGSHACTNTPGWNFLQQQRDSEHVNLALRYEGWSYAH